MKPLKEFPSLESPRVRAFAVAAAFAAVVWSHYWPLGWAS